MTDRASPEFPELITEALSAALDQVWVCCPGKVTAYNPATKTCTVQPVTRRPILTEDGVVEHETPAPAQNVPVAFFGGADLTLVFEPAEGDTVLLVYLDYSPAGWRGRGEVSDAGDVRAHGPSYPVAYPWFRPVGAPGPDGAASIGKPGGLRLSFGASTISAGAGADFVAMAGPVRAELDALWEALNGHVHPGVTPGSGATGTIAPPGGPAGSVASSNLKAD